MRAVLKSTLIIMFLLVVTFFIDWNFSDKTVQISEIILESGNSVYRLNPMVSYSEDEIVIDLKEFQTPVITGVSINVLDAFTGRNVAIKEEENVATKPSDGGKEEPETPKDSEGDKSSDPDKKESDNTSVEDLKGPVDVKEKIDLEKEKYNITIKIENFPITSVSLLNAYTEVKEQSKVLRIKKIRDDVSGATGTEVKYMFSYNPETKCDNITFNFHYEVNESWPVLFECDDWDYGSNECKGSWIDLKVLDSGSLDSSYSFSCVPKGFMIGIANTSVRYDDELLDEFENKEKARVMVYFK
jgi:hypothetical protein